MNRLSLIIIALLAVISLNGCGEKIESAAAAKNIVPVQKVKVESALITEPIITSGRLISEAETKLSFKIPGIVKKIYVNEGDAVKKRKIIASLDLSEINAQFNQAKNGYEKAVRDFERIKKLNGEEVATLEQLQNTETALSIAKSQLEIAQFNLDHSKITAPSDGTILRKLVEENELTNAGYPAVIFGSTSKSWRVKVGVIDKDLVKIKEDDLAKIEVDAFPKNVFTGKVVEISRSANPMSGLFDVEIKLDDSDLKLASGFMARVEIFPSEKKEYKLIPTSALIEAESNRAFVYALNGDSGFRKLEIQISFLVGENIAVESGLENIDYILGEGAVYLTNSSQITIVN